MLNQNLQVMPNSILAKAPLNPVLQVNHGCNLKWKPGDTGNKLLSTTAIFRGKKTARTKRIKVIHFHSRNCSQVPLIAALR